MLTAMVLLKGKGSIDAARFSGDLAEYSGAATEELVKDGSTLLLSVEGATVAISVMPAPVPQKDIAAAARFAYNWPNAAQQAEKHQSHLVVVVSEEQADAVKLHMVLTDVIASLLRTTDAIGVYRGAQSLLIRKHDYLQEAEGMDEDYYPLNVWLYFGLQEGDKGNSGYTYGLKEFGKLELEIVDSAASPEAIRAFLYNMAHYILENEVELADGDTCGLSDEEEIAVRHMPGKFVKGTSCRLLYESANG